MVRSLLLSMISDSSFASLVLLYVSPPFPVSITIGLADGVVRFAAITDLIGGKLAGGVYDGTWSQLKHDEGV